MLAETILTETAPPTARRSGTLGPAPNTLCCRHSLFCVGWDDLDGDNSTDSNTFWNFGTNSQYPVLNVDFNADDDTADDVSAQRPSP